MRPLLAAAAAAVLALAACTKSDADAVPGVRLGMAPHDVRERLVTGGDGVWRTKVGAAADDTAIEWTARNADEARVPHATFEFHLAMLVAVRATVRDPSPPASDTITSTSHTVTLRKAAGPGLTDVTVLARDCPTHHDEAEKLVAKAR